jgi:hypothetical protein
MIRSNCLRIIVAASATFPLLSGALHAQQWIAPTPEELSMTAIPEVPGAPAVYLYKEEKTDDWLHMHSVYVRLKVLTDRGKEYANVELPFFTGEDGSTVDSIAGRTIHPDGTIIPFTGKPYVKLIGKAGGVQEKSKVFTLPSVDVGSIIEYRYKIRIEDDRFGAPDWYVQSDLYLRKGHYEWFPTSKDLLDEKGSYVSGHIMWTPLLPAGATLDHAPLPTGQLHFSLDVKDIAPLKEEQYMPPIDSVSYRVLFYWTQFTTQQEFWTSKGKNWAKDCDKFMQPNSAVNDFVHALVQPGDTEDQKARKLYAAVMKIENTDFTRERTTAEERAEGFKNVKNAGDVLARKRGDSDQLTQLFVSMARAAGLKAYLMGVSDRARRIFIRSYLTLGQLDDYIAIVNIGGKDVFFDPGERYCEPEHLTWRHSFTAGLRETDGGTELSATPAAPYSASHVSRIADLKLDEAGNVTGSVSLTFTGDPAVSWRHQALRGDDASLQEALRKDMEHLLPAGTEVKVVGVENLTDYEQPLKVKYEIKGPAATSTGKRLFLPADIFEVNEKPTFPDPKREVPVDLHYSRMTQDAVRFTFPAEFAAESVPTAAKEVLPDAAGFDMNAKVTPNSVTVFRNVVIAHPIFPPSAYDQLRGFYAKLETKDQETLVLTHSSAAASAAKPAGN